MTFQLCQANRKQKETKTHIYSHFMPFLRLCLTTKGHPSPGEESFFLEGRQLSSFPVSECVFKPDHTPGLSNLAMECKQD